MRTLSAVVITFRGGDLLRGCLDALVPQLGPGDTLIVVKTAASDAVDVAAAEEVGAQLITVDRDEHFARGANRGLRAARGAGVLLLNDDTRALPGFIDALRAAADAPGLYQPRILLADGSGRLDNVGHGLWPDGFNQARGRAVPDGPTFDAPGTVGACSGAAVLITREVLETVGLLDEDLIAFGEDTDLSLRAVRRGFPLRYVPEARIEHMLGASYGRVGARKVFRIERNRVRLAVRSLPWTAVATLPIWTGGRLALTIVAAAAGRGVGAEVPMRAALAGLAGMAAGLLYLPEALGKRRADAAGWTVSEREMWLHLRRERVRGEDIWGHGGN